MISKSAIILSGGYNSRMNYLNKSLLDIEGASFITRQLSELSDYREVLIVSNSTEAYKGLAVKVVSDIIPGKGPLSGIHSGLVHVSCEYSLCLACDMPFISKSLLRHMDIFVEKHDAVVPQVNGKLEPLCAIYKKSCIPVIEKMLSVQSFKLIDMYDSLNVRYIDEDDMGRFFDEKAFININTLTDYEYYTKVKEG